MDNIFTIIHRYVIIYIDIMNWCQSRFLFCVEKKNPVSSHVWSITSDEFWWDNISLLLLLSSIISSFILVIDSVSVSFCKVMSLFNENLVWTLIQGRFRFIKTLSLFDVFELFVSLIIKCELTLMHILFLDFIWNFLPCFLLHEVNIMAIYFTFVK